MRFASPALLWLLAAVPLAGWLYLVYWRRRARSQAFARPHMRPNVVLRSPGWRRHLPIALYLAAAATMLLSLARPSVVRAVPRDRGAVMLVMDTSSSMKARDIAPSRLVAAQRGARAFLDRLPPHFEVGVVGFFRRAHVLSLPTRDREAVLEGIGSITTRFGTAIGDGIDRALALRPKSNEGRPIPTALVLLSDGNNNAGTSNPAEAAERARSQGVAIHTVALGDPEPSPTGRPRPPDFSLLRQLADSTEGRFVLASSGEELERVYGDLGSDLFRVREPQEVTAVLAGAAAALVLAGAGISLLWFNRAP